MTLSGKKQRNYMYIITDKQILKTFLNLTLLYKIFENYTWIVLQLMQRKMYNKLNIFIEKNQAHMI